MPHISSAEKRNNEGQRRAARNMNTATAPHQSQSHHQMQRIVREVAEQGVAVCIVEHNVAFIKDLCDEGVFMFSGAILARGPVADLMRDPQLTELYFGH